MFSFMMLLFRSTPGAAAMHRVGHFEAGNHIPRNLIFPRDIGPLGSLPEIDARLEHLRLFGVVDASEFGMRLIASCQVQPQKPIPLDRMTTADDEDTCRTSFR